MGAVKEMAIELEIRQDEAVALQDPSAAFRLGMLQACSMITEVSGRVIHSDESHPDAVQALNQAWEEVFKAVCYLQGVSPA